MYDYMKALYHRFVETLNASWESKREVNNRRVRFIKLSMGIFFIALGIFVFNYLCNNCIFEELRKC